MKRPAKKNSKSILSVVGAAMVGVAAGAAAVFLSKKDNRDKVQNTVRSAVKRSKTEVAKAKKKAIAVKKKLLKR